MPLSYATYAGNGSTTTFSVPFPYLLKAHVKVYIGFNILSGSYTSELVDGTGFNWTSGTQIQCTTAPAVGQTLTVVRQTPSSSRLVDWNDGSNLIAADLDTADLQNLYVVQEQQDRNDSGISQSTTAATAATAATTAANTATSTANTALSTANTALTNANAAVSTANTASTNASAAVSTANTASTNASAAVTTANAANTTASTASTNASNAVSTANTAAADASTALSTANTALTNANAAVSTANTASTNASAAVATANTASTNASNALSTANTASANASAAVTTANTASTNASNAVNTANAADSKANQAIAAVAGAILYTVVANVAAIPGSPANNTAIEVTDSTGIQSFTPLAGLPGGFTGSAGLSVRIVYSTSGATWNWIQYFPNDPESRYLKLSGGTLTGALTLAGAPSSGGHATTKTYVDAADATLSSAAAAAQATANAALPKAGGTMTGAVTLAADPVSGLQPATKQYVDTADATLTSAAAAAQSTANAALPKAGGTMSGAIAMGTNKITGMGDPAAAQDAATKNYVDTQISGISTSSIQQGNTSISVNDAGTGSANIVVDGTNAGTFLANGINFYQALFQQNSLNLTDQNKISFWEAAANGLNSVGFKGPANIASDVTWTLPATDGSANQALTTDGSATLSWVSYLLSTGGTVTGNVTLDNQADLRFGEATGHGGNWVAFQAPSTIASNVTWTLPATDATVAGHALKSDGAGNLSWGTAGGATGGSGDDVFYENSQVVTTSYALTSNKNAMSAGPITINNGATVTIPSGATWVIV